MTFGNNILVANGRRVKLNADYLNDDESRVKDGMIESLIDHHDSSVRRLINKTLLKD